MKSILLGLIICVSAVAELPPIPVARGSAESALDPTSAAWKSVPVARLALHRTPALYSTDAPAALEITAVQVQVIQAEGKAVVRLEWKDGSRDTAELPAARNKWQSETRLAQTGATDRFFDACAVMLPARPDDVFPSLQMGDAAHPVVIYYYDAVRGPAVMEASGRSTTRRTGKTFPARSTYAGASWQVTMELPSLAAGTPIAVAIWNGRQQDRDGRKYFTVWYRIS